MAYSQVMRFILLPGFFVGTATKSNGGPFSRQSLLREISDKFNVPRAAVARQARQVRRTRLVSLTRLAVEVILPLSWDFPLQPTPHMALIIPILVQFYTTFLNQLAIVPPMGL